MELAYGRVIFESYGSYAADPAADRRHARRCRG